MLCVSMKTPMLIQVVINWKSQVFPTPCFPSDWVGRYIAIPLQFFLFLSSSVDAYSLDSYLVFRSSIIGSRDLGAQLDTVPGLHLIA